jgi:5-oxoprolinase (ATP-hydrolysing) subunit C
VSGGASSGLRVLEAGPAVTVQDLGRRGYGHLGLAASGAIDRRALLLANHLVGGAPGMAALELGLTGGRFRVEGGDLRLALLGAAMPLTIDGVSAEAWRSHTVEAGQVVAIGPAREGIWGYLAVAGGIDVPLVLGSRSTHGRAGLGGLTGGRVRAGDLLPAGTEADLSGPELQLRGGLERDNGEAPVRLVAGPQAEYFDERAHGAFTGQAYMVGQAFDRMAMQLDGEPIAHRDGFNIVSDGIMPGSIQVPGRGLPIVMLADHQTTGGYPKIGTVIAVDLPRLAQRRLGSAVRFRFVTVDEADGARAEANARLRRQLERIAPVEKVTSLAAERLLGLNLIGGVIDAVEPLA